MVRTQVLKHLPGAGKGKRGESKGDTRRGATARRAMEKGRYVGVIDGEEVRREDPVEYFLPMGVRSISWVPEGVMAIEVPQNEEISGGKKELVLPSVGEERIGGGYTLRNDSEEKLFREMLIPT